MNPHRFVAATIIAVSLTLTATAEAQDFYRGKIVHLISSAGTGGGTNIYLRLFAAHVSKYLPGNPTVVIENMPGAGGLRAANFLFNQAPRDGTTVGFIPSGVPFLPIYGNKAALFDARQFNWLGSLDSSVGMCVAWHASSVKTWNDVKTREFVVGGNGAGSLLEILPTLLNKVLQTRIRIVSGYPDGDSVLLAMERGEVDGRCGGMISTLSTVRPTWLPEKKVTIPIVFAEQRLKDYPDSPTVVEMISDPSVLQMLNLLVLAPQEMTRPLLAPPSVPAERIKELRAAFDATMKDEAFLKDASKHNITMDAISGERVAEIIRRAYETPREVVDMARKTLGNALPE